jgi:hypothetical protein
MNVFLKCFKVYRFFYIIILKILIIRRSLKVKQGHILFENSPFVILDLDGRRDEDKEGIPLPPSKPKIWSMAELAVCKTPPPPGSPAWQALAAANGGNVPGGPGINIPGMMYFFLIYLYIFILLYIYRVILFLYLFNNVPLKHQLL